MNLELDQWSVNLTSVQKIPEITTAVYMVQDDPGALGI